MGDASAGSMLTSLKNKAVYHAYRTVNDPDANQFAASSAPPAEPEAPTDDSWTVDVGNDKVNRVLNRMLAIVQASIVPVIALILSMLIANEMIVYSPAVRILFFVFTFIITYVFRPYMVGMILYYLGKGAYAYYGNQTQPDAPKQRVFPKVFAILPIRTTPTLSTLSALFMYPFFYPKTEKDAAALPVLMKDYVDSLHTSFPYFDALKNLPLFSEGAKNIQEQMAHLHDAPKEPVLPETLTPLPPVMEPSVPLEPSAPPMEPSAPSKEEENTKGKQ